MKRLVLISLSFLAVNMSIAQSDKQLTNYMFDNMSFNPATTGFKGYCATAIYRGQWDKVENAPNTMLINVQGSLPNINSGIGISFMNDVIGLGVEKEITLNYSYHLYVPNKGHLSAGLGLGIESIGFDPKWNGPTSGTNSSLDATLPLGASGTGLDVNFGLHWKGNNYYVGLSATHLTQPKLANVNFTKARHYYVMGGYDITNAVNFAYFLPAGMKITPSVLYKTDAVNGILDFNVMMNQWMSGSSNNKGFYAGLTYRHTDAFAIQLGLQMKLYSTSSSINGGTDSGMRGQVGRKSAPDVLKVGYSYDVMTGPLNQYGFGSHELVVNYCVFAPAAAVHRYGNVFILQ
jgi:type IX secretion system PorP/SprF family membrane protein